MITLQESNIEWPKSLVQISADLIRVGIIRRKLVLGQPLIESRLAKDLGISKTPVREGLFLLRSEGLVTAQPNRGYRVFTMTQEELIDFCVHPKSSRVFRKDFFRMQKILLYLYLREASYVHLLPKYHLKKYFSLHEQF